MFFYTHNHVASIVAKANVIVFTVARKGGAFYQQMGWLKANLPEVYNTHQQGIAAGHLKRIGDSDVILHDGKVFVFVAVHENYNSQVSIRALQHMMVVLHNAFDNGAFNAFAEDGVVKVAIIPSGVTHASFGKLRWDLAGPAMAQSGLCEFAQSSSVLHVGIAKLPNQAAYPVLAPLGKDKDEECYPGDEGYEEAAEQSPSLPLSALPDTIDIVEPAPEVVNHFARLSEYWTTLSVAEREAMRLQFIALDGKEVEPAKAPSTSKAPTVKYEEPTFAPGVAPLAKAEEVKADDIAIPAIGCMPAITHEMLAIMDASMVSGLKELAAKHAEANVEGEPAKVEEDHEYGLPVAPDGYPFVEAPVIY